MRSAPETFKDFLEINTTRGGVEDTAFEAKDHIFEDFLEAKDRNGRGQDHRPRTQVF